MTRKQLVLIKASFRDVAGNTRYKIGTGYFIAPALVLTSNHVLPAVDCDRLQVRLEEGGKWLEAETAPRWKSLQLDAALIKTKTRIAIEQPVQWEKNPLEDSTPVNWYSDGYPEAGRELNENKEEYYKTKGLQGYWHPFGGMGAGKNPRLDLEVSAKPANPEQWAGISGAPVFIKNNLDRERLIGIIRNVPTNFPDRLEGIPAFELLKDPDFTAALDEDKFTLPADDNWALIIVSDSSDKDRFTRPVLSALEATMGENFQPVVADINDVLEKPGVFLNFIQMTCRAPIMIIDATGFQPGIMMLMGIRSVVRRGVTIVATINPIDPGLISDPQLFEPLPFNIQEIKLITLDFESYTGRVLSPVDRLKIAISEGKSQLQINPGYLDLPPFDAIRKPVVVDIPAIREKILLLCPFGKDHMKRFNFIRSEVTDGKKTEDILRMLDITSPQLVGQSLYEHIRWCDVCIIDWSNWRANVFYELGVRMAASDIDPVNLIEASELQNLQTGMVANEPGFLQRQLLIRLFEPQVYDIKKRAFPASVKNYLHQIKGTEGVKNIEVSLTRLYPGNIYFTVEKYFDWNQENMRNLPHQNIKKQMEREFGREVTVKGRYNFLYSSNKGFKDAIENQRREYWLCAWYYFYNRYSNEFKEDALKRKELLELGEIVLEALDQESYRSIKMEIAGIIDQFENV